MKRKKLVFKKLTPAEKLLAQFRKIQETRRKAEKTVSSDPTP